MESTCLPAGKLIHLNEPIQGGGVKTLRTLLVLALSGLSLSGCLASGATDPTGVKTALRLSGAIDRVFPDGRRCYRTFSGYTCRSTYSNTYIWYSPRPDYYHTTTVVVPLGICLGCRRRHHRRHYYRHYHRH